jgi:hypothetical protein
MTVLILGYNRMFGQPLWANPSAAPPQVELTEDRRRLKEADVVVFHLPTLNRLLLPRKPRGQVWVAWYMECEQHYRSMQNARFMSRFELKLCYRRDADIMVSYVPVELQQQRLKRLTLPQHQHLACSFISGRADRSGRLAYLRELARHLEVHEFGRLSNRTIPNDRGRASKLEALPKYRFCLAFENAIAPDYVTEKFYDPLLAGSVPVYLGAPNIAEFAPVEGCYINAADFAGPAELAAYLLQLNRDEPAYDRFLNWQERAYTEPFKALCQEIGRPVLERLCERASVHLAAHH